jgi:hypothetical protein
MSTTDTTPKPDAQTAATTDASTADTTETAAGDSAAPAEPEPEDSDDDTGREAAKWRKKLRATEAERDALAEKLESVQRQQVENLLAASNVKPQAVWAVAELSELLAEDGTIDAERVTQAVEAAREKFGITTPSKGSVVPGVGNQPSSPPKVDGWKQAFTPSRKR